MNGRVGRTTSGRWVRPWLGLSGCADPAGTARQVHEAGLLTEYGVYD